MKNGIKTYEISLDAQLTEQIADNSTVLASSSDKNATVLVTEEQILVVHNAGEILRAHTHSVHAAVSKDFVVTVDEQRKVNIYNIA